MKNPKISNRVFKSKPLLGLRRFSPYQIEHNDEGKRIRIFWPRLFLWLLVLGLFSWTALTAGVFFYLKHHRDYTTVSYNHLFFYPWKSKEYRQARSQFLVQKGKEQFDNKQYLEAFMNIRLGLFEVPEDTEARTKVVEFYVALKRHDMAEKTLADGLPYNKEDWDYVMTYFRYLFSRQLDERVIEISQRLQNEKIKNPKVRHALVMAEASANYFRGRYNRAGALLQGEFMADAGDAKMLSAQILWHRGQIDSALNALADLSSGRGSNEEIYTVRIGFLQELGRLNDVRSLAILRQLEEPTSYRGFIDELFALNPDTEPMRWSAAVTEVFLRFPEKAEAMTELANLASKQGQVDLGWRVYRHCLQKDLPWMSAAFGVVEAHFSTKRYGDALTAIQTITDEHTDWAAKNPLDFAALKAIATYGLGDKPVAEILIQSYLEKGPVLSQNLIQVAKRMEQVGALDHAHSVLNKAIEINAFNQEALTRLIELDLQMESTEGLIKNTERMLTMRNPSKALLGTMQEFLESDIYLMQPGRAGLMQKLGVRLAEVEL